MTDHCCTCKAAESLMDGYRHGMGRAAIVIDAAATQMRNTGDEDLLPAAVTLAAIADSLRRTSASARVVTTVVADAGEQ